LEAPCLGPGLVVHCLGVITKEKLDVLRDCEEILLEESVSANLYRNTDQAFAVVKGDSPNLASGEIAKTCRLIMRQFRA